MENLLEGGTLPCKLDGSKVASGLILQKSKAAPIFGFTESPLFAHSDISFHPGAVLKFPVEAGKTVSPPSSTSDLHVTEKKNPKLYQVVNRISQGTNLNAS